MDDLSPSQERDGAEERRAHRRRPAEARVDVVLEDGTGVVGLRTLGVSEGGMFIVADRPPEPGSRLKFGLRLGPGSAIVRGVGEVRWRREQEDEEGRPPGAGVAMVSLSDECRQVLVERLRLLDSGDLEVAAGGTGRDVTGERETELPAEAAPPEAEDAVKTAPGAGPLSAGGRDDRVPNAVELQPEDAVQEWSSAPSETSGKPPDESQGAPNGAKSGGEPPRSAPPAGVTPARPVPWPKKGGEGDERGGGGTRRWLGPVVAATILVLAVVVLLVLPRLGRNIGLDTGREEVAAGTALPEDVTRTGERAAGPLVETEREVRGGALQEPVGSEARPVAATEVVSARWKPSGDGTQIVVTLNGRLEPERVDDLRLESPPRYLVRVEGIVTAPGPTALQVDNAPVPVRVGHHPELRPPELHLVVDLAGSDQASTSWTIDGGTRLVVTVTP